jgi:hypothetical protein
LLVEVPTWEAEVKDAPDISLEEVSARLQAEIGVAIGGIKGFLG